MARSTDDTDAKSISPSSSDTSDASSAPGQELSRRKFLGGSVATGVALGAASSAIGWKGAIAQSKRLVVTTMPGPRWEQALTASAKAYMAANPDVEIEILVSGYAEHYQRIGTSLIEDSSDFDAHLFDAALIGQSYPKLVALKRSVRRRSGLEESLPERRATGLSRQLGLGRRPLFRRPRCQLHDDLVAHGHLRAVRSPRARIVRTDSREHACPEREQARIWLHDLRRPGELVPRHDLHRHDACLWWPLVRERRDGPFRPHRPG